MSERKKTESFIYGLRPLSRKTGNETYLESKFYSRKVYESYSKDQLFVGWSTDYEWLRTPKMWFKRSEKEPLYIDTSQSEVFLVLGKRGSGKTFLTRSMLSRLHESGYAVIHLSDIKNEMKSNWKPVQKQFADKLNQRENPKPIPTQMFIPIFLRKFYSRMPDHTKLIQLSLADLEENDFITLFEPENDKHVDILRSVYSKVERGKVQTLADMEEAIRKMRSDEVHSATKRGFYLKLKDMRDKKLLDVEYNQDIVDYINRGIQVSDDEYLPCVVSLSMRYYDNLAKGYPQAYLSVIIEKIRRARRNNKIKKPIFFVVDEAHVYLPKNSDPSCKEKIKQVINVDRYLGESIIISTQYPKQLPEEDILKQVRYYFIPYNIDMDIFKHIIKVSGLAKPMEDAHSDKWQKFYEKAKRYNWFLIDKNRRSIRIVDVAAPLCNHMSEIR